MATYASQPTKKKRKPGATEHKPGCALISFVRSGPGGNDAFLPNAHLPRQRGGGLPRSRAGSVLHIRGRPDSGGSRPYCGPVLRRMQSLAGVQGVGIQGQWCRVSKHLRYAQADAPTGAGIRLHFYRLPDCADAPPGAQSTHARAAWPWALPCPDTGRQSTAPCTGYAISRGEGRVAVRPRV